MTHDLRPLGFKRLVALDPEEQRLRERWYITRERVISDPGSLEAQNEHRVADAAICSYVWNRATRTVAEDRAKHPKARRNALVPLRTDATGAPGRYLP